MFAALAPMLRRDSPVSKEQRLVERILAACCATQIEVTERGYICTDRARYNPAHVHSVSILDVSCVRAGQHVLRIDMGRVWGDSVSNDDGEGDRITHPTLAAVIYSKPGTPDEIRALAVAIAGERPSHKETPGKPSATETAH